VPAKNELEVPTSFISAEKNNSNKETLGHSPLLEEAAAD
jgi:hypothetical protein